MRDYEQWHDAYDDPDSGLSWRLRTVQRYIEQFLDERTGPVRVLSCCSGDGRDLLGVLARRTDDARVTGTLVEIHPAIAERARATAASCTARIEVRTADAGNTDAYRGAVPADLVIMIGIFGNISNADLERTIGAAPELCARDATLLWSRGRDRSDENDAVRSWFAAAGFVELDYAALDAGSRPAAGAMRYNGEPRVLDAGKQLFTFLR